MYKEIQFRAWLKNEKKMVDVYSFYIAHKKISYEIEDETEEEFKFLNIGVMDIREAYLDEIELMQYIKVKDINGMEIFEKDILLEFEGKKTCVVIWNSLECRYELDYGDYQVPCEYCSLVSYTVIGNIYENPELLTA